MKKVVASLAFVAAFFLTVVVVQCDFPPDESSTSVNIAPVPLEEDALAEDLSPAQRFELEIKACAEAYAGGLPGKCKLYGKIQYVDVFPDVKVQVVDAFPDIKVKIVDAFPDSPGMWKIVDVFPDYKVQKVTAFPDYKIKFVDAFPGCD